MITNSVSLPSNRFTLSDGFRTCVNGKLYVGALGTDATVTANQIDVFYLNSNNVETTLTQPIQLDAIGRPTDNNGNFANVYVKENYSITIIDAYGVTQLTVTDLPIYTAGSFADLRNITPMYAGQTITLTGWNSGSTLGGGEFVAVMSNGTDDGGTIATNSATAGYYWERIYSDFLTPEMFGAVGDGATDDTVSLQAAFTSWKSITNKSFYGPGVYVLSAPVKVISPIQGSQCRLNNLIKNSTWTDASTSLFSRTGALLVLDLDASNASGMWGSKLEIGYLQDLSSKSSPKDYFVHGINNLGWQQCEISIGLAQGLISAVNILNTKSTSPTVRYKLKMGRGNLINFHATYNIANMFEGSSFETMWSSGGLFSAEMLGNGSTYTHILGGSADFAGQYLNFVSLASMPSAIKTGDEVTDSNGNMIGWVIGFRYYSSSSTRTVIVAELNSLANSTGVPTNSAISSGSTITFSGSTYTVTGISCGNTSHTASRFLPTAICTATTSQTIVRWRIERDYDSGVIFPNDVYYADSLINVTNEAARRKTTLPLGANFDSSITNGQLTLNGSRYTTRLSVNNLEINSFGGFNTAKHSSIWKMIGAAATSVLVSDSSSTTTVAFTLASLGGGTVSGRISGRSTDPATDTVGLWELTGFGTNLDGSVALDKWDVLWNGGSGFYITKSVAGTKMALTTTTDSSGNATLTLTGGMTTSQAAVGGSWQYRITALRKIML